MIVQKPLEYEELFSQKCLWSSNLPGSPRRTHYNLRCAHPTSPLWGYCHSKISRDTIPLLGESPGCGRCPYLWQGGGMTWAWSSLPSQTLLGWSYHSHTLSLYLHIQHYITDHNLQWQKDAAVKVITPNSERCLASFNLCHLPERQSNECTQKSLHKIIQQEP